MAWLEVENLCYTYPGGSRPALSDVCLEVNEGEFILLAGGSGSGKSTLLRLLCRLIPDLYGGKVSGRITVDGRDLADLSRRDLITTVGMVYENPDSQLVMTTVEQEMAFGLENMGVPVRRGRQRMAELAETLGLNQLLEQAAGTLSGGQKQKTALASVLALNPRMLLLDEPTSRLDPVAAEEVISFLRRLSEENGLTIIMAEQRLERCYHLADRVVYMEEGRILKDGPPGEAARWAVTKGCPFVPPVPALFARAGGSEIPLTVKEGKAWLRRNAGGAPAEEKPPLAPVKDASLKVEQVSFRYPGGPQVLKGITLAVARSRIMAVMGANGSGKSTLLKNIMGLLAPGQGRIYLEGRQISGQRPEVLARQIGYLPQEAGEYFFLPTVGQEIELNVNNLGLPDSTWWERLNEMFALNHLKDRNPRDLSRGERQKAALACVLLPRPRLLLLDEPTQGLDCLAKQQLGGMLQDLARGGLSVVMVTHDVEFAAAWAHDAAFLHQGAVIGQGSVREMLCGNMFYSPQVNRLCGGSILTEAEALEYIKMVSTFMAHGVGLRCEGQAALPGRGRSEAR